MTKSLKAVQRQRIFSQRLSRISYFIGFLSFLFPLALAVVFILGDSKPLDAKGTLEFAALEFVALIFFIGPLLVAINSLMERLFEQLERHEPDIECHLVGNHEDAISHIAKVYEDPRSRLIRVRDTHFRGRGYQEFANDSYELLERSLKKFLNRPKTSLIVVAGAIADTKYVQQLISADTTEKGGGRKVKSHRLTHSEPILNFMILDYDDNRSEVFFGWGRYSDGLSESVFRSSEDRLVAEFSNIFDSMLRSSGSEVPLNDLLRPLSVAVTQQVLDSASTTRRTEDWMQLPGLIAAVERGPDSDQEDLRILTTHFIDWISMHRQLKRLLEKGVRIKILMIDPGNEQLMLARYGLRQDSERLQDAKIQLPKQINDIENLKTFTDMSNDCRGKLEMYVSNCMPCGFYVHSRERVIFGILPAMGAMLEGPMFEGDRNSELWKTLDIDWRTRWSDAQSNGQTIVVNKSQQ